MICEAAEGKAFQATLQKMCGGEPPDCLVVIPDRGQSLITITISEIHGWDSGFFDQCGHLGSARECSGVVDLVMIPSPSQLLSHAGGVTGNSRKSSWTDHGGFSTKYWLIPSTTPRPKDMAVSTSKSTWGRW